MPVALWLEVGRLTWHGGLGGRGASAFLQRPGPADSPVRLRLALRFLLELGESVMLTGGGLMYASSSSREGKRLAFSRVDGLMKVADEARRCCGGAGGGAADPRWRGTVEWGAGAGLCRPAHSVLSVPGPGLALVF